MNEKLKFRNVPPTERESSFAKRTAARGQLFDDDGDDLVDDDLIETARSRKPLSPDFSDTDIKDYILERLSKHPSLNIEKVVVLVAAGSVNLQGSVDSTRSKMLVEEIVEALPGVRSIVNHIRVDI